MDLAALGGCLTSVSCIVTQSTSGLIIGLLLFLVAAGVSLIFGVLKVVNFAHGSFYMLGAYFALTAYKLSGNYAVAVIAAGIGVAIFGLLFERLLMSRVYGSPVLMQLLVCYGVILILDDTSRSSGAPISDRSACPIPSSNCPLFSPAAWCRCSTCS